MGAIAKPNMQAMSEEYHVTYQRQPRCPDFDTIHLISDICVIRLHCSPAAMPARQQCTAWAAACIAPYVGPCS